MLQNRHMRKTLANVCHNKYHGHKNMNFFLDSWTLPSWNKIFWLDLKFCHFHVTLRNTFKERESSIIGVCGYRKHFVPISSMSYLKKRQT